MGDGRCGKNQMEWKQLNGMERMDEITIVKISRRYKLYLTILRKSIVKNNELNKMKVSTKTKMIEVNNNKVTCL